MAAGTSAGEILVTLRPDTRRLEQDVQKALRRVERQAKRTGASAKRGLKPLGTGLSAATVKADEFTKSLEASNARVLAFGASAGAFYAVGTAIKEMVAQTIEVEKRLAMINVLMGQTSGKLQEFGHTLFDIAKDTGQSFDAVATAANELVRQGLSSETILLRVKDAMILVRMSGMDAKLAVDSLTAAINGFNEAGLDSTRVVNVMANVAANFAVSETDLAEAIRRAGSTAKEAGVNFKQLVAIVSAAQQRTARGGAVIGNAFKSIFTKIHRPRTLDALEMVGIKTREASGQLKSSLEILEALAKQYDKLSDSQRSQITQLMGGLYQVNILKAAVRDLSDNYSLYNNALDVANKTTDEATQRNLKLNLTLSAMINRMVEGSKEMASMMGKMVVGPGLESFFKTLDKIISAITSLKADSGWAKILKGVLEGLGSFLTGPGLAIGVALIGKLAIQFGGFLMKSVGSILNLNTAATQQASIQKIITAELSMQPGLVARLTAQGMSNLQIQKYIVTELAAQQALLITNARLAQQTAAYAMGAGFMVGRGGAMKGPGIPRARALGHIPNFNKQDTMAESVGAAMGGYKPGRIKSMNMPGLGKVTYNTAEKVSSVPGFAQPFISPPQGSKAGRAHKREALSKTGINPYALAEGFIPNFMGMMARQAMMAKTNVRGMRDLKPETSKWALTNPADPKSGLWMNPRQGLRGQNNDQLVMPGYQYRGEATLSGFKGGDVNVSLSSYSAFKNAEYSRWMNGGLAETMSGEAFVSKFNAHWKNLRGQMNRKGEVPVRYANGDIVAAPVSNLVPRHSPHANSVGSFPYIHSPKGGKVWNDFLNMGHAEAQYGGYGKFNPMGGKHHEMSAPSPREWVHQGQGKFESSDFSSKVKAWSDNERLTGLAATRGAFPRFGAPTAKDEMMHKMYEGQRPGSGYVAMPERSISGTGYFQDKVTGAVGRGGARRAEEIQGRWTASQGFVPNFNPLRFLHYGKIGQIKNWQKDFYTHSDFGGLHVAGERGMREGIFGQMMGAGKGRKLYEVTTNLQKGQIARAPDFGAGGMDDMAAWAYSRNLLKPPGGWDKKGLAVNQGAKLAFEERLGLDELGMVEVHRQRGEFFRELEKQSGIRAFNYKNVYEGLSSKAYSTSRNLKYSDILPSLHITDPRAITGIREVPLSRFGGLPRVTPEKNQIRAQQEIEGGLTDPRLIKLKDQGLLTYAGGFVPNFLRPSWGRVSQGKMKENLRGISDKMPKDDLQYYSRAYEDYYRMIGAIKSPLGLPRSKFSKTMSALSPSNQIEKNIIDTISMRLAQREGISSDAVRVSTFHQNKAKASEILKGTASIGGKGSPKTGAFHENIMNPFDPRSVTVDFRAAGQATGRQYTTTSVPDLKVNAAKGETRYSRVEGAFKDVAAEEGMIGQQFQAALWMRGRQGSRSARGQDRNRALLRQIYENPTVLQNLTLKDWTQMVRSNQSRLGSENLITIPRPSTLSAEGFVPSFFPRSFGGALARLGGRKGLPGRTEVVGAEEMGMHPGYDKFLADLRSGLINKSKLPSGLTRRDLERAEYGIMEAAPRFNAMDKGQYGFNPFMGNRILKRDVDPLLKELGYLSGGFVPNFMIGMPMIRAWAKQAKPKDLTQIGAGSEGTAWGFNVGGSRLAIKSPGKSDMFEFGLSPSQILKGLSAGNRGVLNKIAAEDPMMAMRLETLAAEAAYTKAAVKSGIPVEPVIGVAPAAGFIKRAVTPLDKTSLGRMGMLDGKFLYELREAMVVKGLTGKGEKFLTNDMFKYNNFSTRDVVGFEKAYLAGKTPKEMIDAGHVQALDAGGFQLIHRNSNWKKYLKQHPEGSAGRHPEAIFDYIKQAEGNFQKADLIGLGRHQGPYVSSGFIPNFMVGAGVYRSTTPAMRRMRQQDKLKERGIERPGGALGEYLDGTFRANNQALFLQSVLGRAQLMRGPRGSEAYKLAQHENYTAAATQYATRIPHESMWGQMSRAEHGILQQNLRHANHGRWSQMDVIPSANRASLEQTLKTYPGRTATGKNSAEPRFDAAWYKNRVEQLGLPVSGGFVPNFMIGGGVRSWWGRRKKAQEFKKWEAKNAKLPKITHNQSQINFIDREMKAGNWDMSKAAHPAQKNLPPPYNQGGPKGRGNTYQPYDQYGLPTSPMIDFRGMSGGFVPNFFPRAQGRGWTSTTREGQTELMRQQGLTSRKEATDKAWADFLVWSHKMRINIRGIKPRDLWERIGRPFKRANSFVDRTLEAYIGSPKSGPKMPPTSKYFDDLLGGGPKSGGFIPNFSLNASEGHVPNFMFSSLFASIGRAKLFGGGRAGKVRERLHESIGAVGGFNRAARQRTFTDPLRGLRDLSDKEFFAKLDRLPRATKAEFAKWMVPRDRLESWVKNLTQGEKVGRFDRFVQLAARGADSRTLSGYVSGIRQQQHYTRDTSRVYGSEGFVPAFSSALDRSIKGEKLGIRMSGRGGTAKVGYDPRVGVGVYTSNQGSLPNAINQHLAGGQPRSTLGRTGMGLQKATKSKGYVPNFMEGTEYVGGGMGVGMLAFAFMGMGDASRDLGIASKVELKTAYTVAQQAEQSHQKKMLNIGQEHGKLMTNLTTQNTALSQQRVLYDTMLKAGTAGGGAGQAAMRNILTLESQIIGLNASLQANLVAQTAGTAQTTVLAGEVAAANAAKGTAGLMPKAGGGHFSKWGTRGMIAGGVAQKMALPMAFMAPMMGGMLAGGMPGLSQEERGNRALVGGYGSAAGYGAIGAMGGHMVGGMVAAKMAAAAASAAAAQTGAAAVAGTAATTATAGSAVPVIGTAIGLAIGTTVGVAMAHAAKADEMLKVFPKLAAQSELATAALKDFNNGTSVFVRALGDYGDAIRDTTGRLTAVDLKERRDTLMGSIEMIPEANRAGILSVMNDPKRMKSMIAREAMKLNATAESSSLQAGLSKQMDERRGGVWGTSIFDWSNDEDEAFVQSAKAMRYAESGDPNKKIYDTMAGSAEGFWNVPISVTKEGTKKMDEMMGKYVRSMDLSGKSTAELTVLMKEMDNVFNKTNSNMYKTQKEIIDIFAGLGAETAALRKMTLMDVQYMAASYQQHLLALSVNDEMMNVLTASLNKQKDSADRARESVERMEDALQGVFIKTNNAVGALTTFANASEDLQFGERAGGREVMQQEMYMKADLLKPFMGPEQALQLKVSMKMASLMNTNTNKLESIDSAVRKELLKGLAGNFTRSTTNMTKAFQSAVRGDRSKLETFLTRAGKTRPQANALAQLVELVGAKMKVGTGTDELMTFVKTQIATNKAVFGAISADNTVLNNVLETIRTASESGYSAMLKANQMMEQQIRLQELQAKYAQELIRIQKTLSYQGGIQSFGKGAHSGLLAVGNVAREMQLSTRSISPTISEGRAAFKSADMFKNFFGAENIPEELKGQAVAGRAMQMEQTAREYEVQTGIQLPKWMKDMTSPETMEAATNQVEATLKDQIPQKLDEVRDQILKLQETLVAENARQQGTMSTQMTGALENVMGASATNITGGGKGTITSLIEQQANLFKMQVDQKKVAELQIDTQAKATQRDTARLDLVRKSNVMITAFRDAMLSVGTKEKGDVGKHFEEWNRKIGKKMLDPIDPKGTSFAEVKELHERRMKKMRDLMAGVSDMPSGLPFVDQLREITGYINDMTRKQVADTAWEDTDFPHAAYAGMLGRIQHGAEQLGKIADVEIAGGGYQAIIEQFNQAAGDLRDVNDKRIAAETNLINTINSFSAAYGANIPSKPVSGGPNIVPPAGNFNFPIATPHAGGYLGLRGGGMPTKAMLKMLGFKAKGTDIIPAMLTPNEFVVNAKDAKRNRGLLEYINSGKMSYSKRGGVMYAQGGTLFGGQMERPERTSYVYPGQFGYAGATAPQFPSVTGARSAQRGDYPRGMYGQRFYGSPSQGQHAFGPTGFGPQSDPTMSVAGFKRAGTRRKYQTGDEQFFDKQIKQQLAGWKDAIDGFIKGIEDADVDLVLRTLNEGISKQGGYVKDGITALGYAIDKGEEKYEEQQKLGREHKVGGAMNPLSASAAQKAHSASMVTMYAKQAEAQQRANTHLRTLQMANNESKLSLDEIFYLWKTSAQGTQMANAQLRKAVGSASKVPKWLKDIRDSFKAIPEELAGMESTLSAWKKRSREIIGRIQDIDAIMGTTPQTPAGATTRGTLSVERTKLQFERTENLGAQTRLTQTIAAKRAGRKPSVGYDDYVEAAAKRRKEGMRGMLETIYGGYQRPTKEEAIAGLKQQGNVDPDRKQIEEYQIQQSKWKGLSIMGQGFIDPSKAFPDVSEYRDRLNKQISDGIAKKFEASGQTAMQFFKDELGGGEGLVGKGGLKRTGSGILPQQMEDRAMFWQMKRLKTARGMREGGKTVTKDDERKLFREEERKEAAEMIRGDVYFSKKHKKGGGPGAAFKGWVQDAEMGGDLMVKNQASANAKAVGMWNYMGKEQVDHVSEIYEIQENIKDAPKFKAALNKAKGTTKKLEEDALSAFTDKVINTEAGDLGELGATEDVFEKLMWVNKKGQAASDRDAGTFLSPKEKEKLLTELFPDEEKRKVFEKKLNKTSEARWKERTAGQDVDQATNAYLQQRTQQFDNEIYRQMDLGGVDKDQMLTDEFGNKKTPTEMFQYLNEPKFKATLDIGKLSQDYDKYSGSLDRSFDAMNNLKSATEYRIRVQQRFAVVSEKAKKAGMSVNKMMSAMANEMKDVALNMKLERGEISGRQFRAGQIQINQNKVDTGTYGFGDMRGQFLSHFTRNAKDDMQDLKDLIDATAVGMRDGFKKAFKEFAFGTKTAKEAFRDFAMEIMSMWFSKAIDFSTENFMSYLMGQRKSGGGMIQDRARGGLIRGYANGGRVMGGTGPRSDDVPLFASGGEYVIQASSAKKIGYENLDMINQNAKKSKRFARGGGISAVLRNQLDFNDVEQPTKLIYNIDPMLSVIGQEDQINPQNRKRFEREEAFYSYRQSEFQREKANAEKMAAFKKQKKQMLKAGRISALMSLTSAYAGYLGDTTSMGRFMNSIGGKTLISAGIGAMAGGKQGAIMGAVSGLTAGVLGKWQKEQDSKDAIKFQKDLAEMMATPDFQKQLKLSKERQGLKITGAPDQQHMFGAQNIPQEFQNVFRDRERLKAIEKELHNINPAWERPAGMPVKKGKSFWEGLAGLPGAIGRGLKAPFGGEFWGRGGDHAYGGPISRRRKFAEGGIVSDTTGQFSMFNKSFGSDQVMNIANTELNPQGSMDGSRLHSMASGLVSDAGMYAHGGPTEGPSAPRSGTARSHFQLGNLGRNNFKGELGDFGKDSILARVSRGEFIFGPDATNLYGPDALKALNMGDMEGFFALNRLQRGEIPGFAGGGYVGAGLPSLTPRADLTTGGGNGIESVNQNLVKLIDSVDSVRESIDSQSNDQMSPNETVNRGGSREISNNISISVNIDKSGKVEKNEGSSQDSNGEGDPDEDRKEQEKSKKLGMMMEVEILKVITEQKRPGGLLDD